MTRSDLSRRTFLTGTGLLLVSGLAGCTTLLGGQSGITTRRTGEQTPAVPAGTHPEDTVIGLREHPRIISAYGGVYEHRKTEVMLARMVSNLLAAAEQPNTQFTITILDSSEVNAFALPGGFIYVTRGILALANDMSELAAVIAHEIAHVTLRHARARSNRVRTSEIVDRVITGVLGGVIDASQTAERTAQSLAAFSQGQELEADREGIKIASRAGYDPHAAARFLTRWAGSPSSPPRERARISSPRTPRPPTAFSAPPRSPAPMARRAPEWPDAPNISKPSMAWISAIPPSRAPLSASATSTPPSA